MKKDTEFYADAGFSVGISIPVLQKKVKAVYNRQMASIDYLPFWEETIKQIENFFLENGKEAEFHLWFNISYIGSQENKITVSVPSTYIFDQMKYRGYTTLLQNKILEISGQDIELEIIVVPKNKSISTSSATSSKTIQQTIGAKPHISEKNPVQNNIHQEKSDTIKPVKKNHPALNPYYTFENFVSGDENEYVYNASLAAAKNPGKVYNPLLIYGGVGLGKTHLMQAIGNEIYKNSGLNIIYISAENFTNEFIASIHNKTQSQFKSKYRNTDVLLIDDIHFFEDKEGTQEELFHTFNALYDNNKQLVFTCDRPVSELKNITDRLKSRFQRGLNADIHMPKYEIRRAIIEHKLNFMNKNLPVQIIDVIAQHIQTNVRDLEACLNTVTAFADLTKEPLTVEKVKDIISKTFSQNISVVSVEIIQRVVADYFNISFTDIKGKKRSKNIAFPRHIAFYLARELTDYSTTELGNDFGGRDHSTIMHGCQKIEEKLYADSTLEETISILKKKIKEYKKE